MKDLAQHHDQNYICNSVVEKKHFDFGIKDVLAFLSDIDEHIKSLTYHCGYLRAKCERLTQECETAYQKVIEYEQQIKDMNLQFTQANANFQAEASNLRIIIDALHDENKKLLSAVSTENDTKKDTNMDVDILPPNPNI